MFLHTHNQMYFFSLIARTFPRHKKIQCHRHDQANVHDEDGQICWKWQICTMDRQEAVAKQGDDDQDVSHGFDGFDIHGGLCFNYMRLRCVYMCVCIKNQFVGKGRGFGG